MFREPTVLILGAGASMPYGFPSGTQLIEDICSGKPEQMARLIEKEGRGDLVIAAGDDSNDLSLFDAADFKIAMPHAPASLLERADFIAPPTSEFVIFTALAKAITR